MKKEKKQSKIGGIVFLSSLLFLFILNLMFMLLAPAIFSGSNSLNHWAHFLIGALVGAFSASVIITGRLRVFFHELNHKILSGLVGNKPKKLRVGKDEGFFEYEYTKETAAYNAFIALAPYFFPLFTICALVIALIGWRHEHALATAVVGIGYGADIFLNTCAISPVQTDFSSLRGGYPVGLAYVTLITTALFFVLATWVTNGFPGYLSLFGDMLALGLQLITGLKSVN